MTLMSKVKLKSAAAAPALWDRQSFPLSEPLLTAMALEDTDLSKVHHPITGLFEVSVTHSWSWSGYGEERYLGYTVLVVGW